MTYTLADTLLKVDNVSLSFGDKLILRDISLEIKDIIGTTQVLGQVITLLGPSGVGKTQLFKIIAGLMAPSGGQVLVGREQKPVGPGIVGMVLQSYPLFKHYTLEENLKISGKPKDIIEGYMSDFDIIEHRSKYPQQLSGGQRQRTAIVQQILSSEHFILLDEPFSGLDPRATEKLSRVINKIANQDEQNTIIISSHILEPSLAVSDRAIMIGYEGGSNKIPGATITYDYNLAANGLAWQPDIRREYKFTQLVEEIRNIFNK